MEKPKDPKPKAEASTVAIKKIEHSNVYAALSAFQGELKPFEKNGHVKYAMKNGSGDVDFHYTPLGDIMAAIYPLLAKHGLSVRHEIVKEDMKDGIVAILTHETFEEAPIATERVTTPDGAGDVVISEKLDAKTKNQIKSGVVRISAGADMKDTGAAITYARRYTLTMLLGIASEDDNDASLLEETAKNAANFAFTKAKAGLESAKTTEAVDKALKVLESDLQKIADGKAPALGLSKEQYEELVMFGNGRKTVLKEEGK